MQSITVRGTVQDELRGTKTLVEVRDEEGTVIGFFAPITLENASRYVEAAAGADPTPTINSANAETGKTSA
jgi:hypothetical protein